MQNKGFVMTFAILLALVCCFYLSFSFVTKSYEKKASEYAHAYATENANEDDADENNRTELYDQLYGEKYNSYLDSMSTEKVWMTFSWVPFVKEKNLGYTLKECSEKEIGLGLDLKGGMSVIVEVDVAEVLRSLGDPNNPAFVKAVQEASIENRTTGSSRDYITIFVDKFKKEAGNDKMAAVFALKLKDQMIATDNDAHVEKILREELDVVAENSFNVLRTRIDRFGVVAPNIQKLDNRAERILIELPGIKEPERVRKLLQGSANLEFWKTYTLDELMNLSGYGNCIAKLDERSAAALENRTVVTTAATDSTAIAGDSLKIATDIVKETGELGFKKSFSASFISLGGGSIVGFAHRNDTAAINAIIRTYKDSYPSDLRFAWGFKASDKKETQFALYALRGDILTKGPALDGDVIVSARADQSQRGSAWEVDMQMSSNGTTRWANITGSEIGRSIAIVLDGQVYSAPNVNQKIEGGRSQISGDFTAEDAKDLENVLKSGKMRAGVHIIQEDIVGPSLGQEAIDAGMISFVIALILVMIFMCVMYGLIPGMVANGALLLNLFFTMGILASFGAVMTLPGIIGIVLSLGMAVDANVLIYERAKEELRAGKSVKVALADGYKNAFSAIFDANLTSIITAAILILFGTGAIQGFATTLIIGIAASFFTAVFMTRLFFEFMMSQGKFKNLTFTTVVSRNLFVNTKINFLGMTKKITIAVVIFVVVGLASLFINGLNKGIDFTGGRNYLVRFDKSVNAGEIEQKLATKFEGYTVRVLTSSSANQTISSSQVRITTNYKVEDSRDEVETEIRDIMTQALSSELDGEKLNVISSQRVGPSIAEDLQKSATIAVVLAILCMGFYILIRFRDIAFSVGTLIAVAHDAIMVILLYSILYKIMPFSMEVDQSFIAAILTVVGYSINDKVVIFDRIREIRGLYPKKDITLTVNESLNATLGRTINTAFSTLLGVFIIFILGGENIRSFTFAIFIGIIIGTFSSVFIATPIAWNMLKKKQDKKGLEK